MSEIPEIEVQRVPYEEPNHTQLLLRAWNGSFGGALDFYCHVSDLGAIAAALTRFPARVPDEYIFEYGSADPSARCYRHLVVRAYTTDARGSAALQFRMSLNQSEPTEGTAAFSIPVEEQQLARLGALFDWLEKHPNGWFRWSPTSDSTSESGKDGASQQSAV